MGWLFHFLGAPSRLFLFSICVIAQDPRLSSATGIARCDHGTGSSSSSSIPGGTDAIFRRPKDCSRKWGYPNYNADHEKGEVPVDGIDGKRLLARQLKGRHMQMIAIGIECRSPLQLAELTSGTGGSIGAGLFVGSGSALSTGGPASLV